MSNQWKEVGDSVREILRSKNVRVRALSEDFQPIAPNEPIKSNRNLWLIGLTILAVTLALAIFVMQGQESGRFSVVPNEEVKVQPTVVGPSNSEVIDKIASLDKRVSLMDKKLMLLGAANNNNWFTISNGKNVDDVVYFGSDWKLDKMPPHITMSEEQKALFRQWVR